MCAVLLLTACSVPPNDIFYISPVDRDGQELIPSIDTLLVELTDTQSQTTYSFTISEGDEDPSSRTGIPDISSGTLTLWAYQEAGDQGLFLDAWGRLDGLMIGPTGDTSWVILGQPDRFNLLPTTVESSTGATLTLGDSERIFAVATLLPSGMVLLTGGSTTPNRGSEAVDRALLFNDGEDTGAPGTREAGGDASMFSNRIHHSATLLETNSTSDAQVALVGGDTTLRVLDDARIHRISTDLTGSQPSSSIEVYSAASDTFTRQGETTLTHALHTATPLPDARLLIAGGVGVLNSTLQLQPGLEILTFTNGLSSSQDLGELLTPRVFHSAGAFSYQGEVAVLVVGGVREVPTTETELSPELLVDQTEIITLGGGSIAGPTLGEARAGAAIVALQDGRLLIVGGTATRTTDEGAELLTPVDTLEVFDPDDLSITPVIGHLSYARAFHSLVPLEDDTFMVVGGQGRQTSHLPPEIITLSNVSNGLKVAARPLGEEPLARLVGEAIAPLPDGKVLLVGGYSPSSSAWANQPASRLVYFPWPE